MKLFEKHGYGPNAYVVKHENWNEICKWLYTNNVDWWQLSSGPNGIGFQVKSHIEWFNLKWL